MTRKERLELIIQGKITEELIEDCKIELQKLNSANEKRKEKTDPRKEENTKIMNEIIAILDRAGAPMQIEAIMERLTDKTLTRQRVSSLCTILIKEGQIVSHDVKVKNKGKRKAYSIE